MDFLIKLKDLMVERFGSDEMLITQEWENAGGGIVSFDTINAFFDYEIISQLIIDAGGIPLYYRIYSPYEENGGGIVDDLFHVCDVVVALVNTRETPYAIKGKRDKETPLHIGNFRSSNLRQVWYYEKEKRLVVEFLPKRGQRPQRYEYYNVPKKVYMRLIAAASKGSYFYHNIRTTFKYKRIQ